MSSEGILSSSLAGKNECQLCEKSFVYCHDLLRHQHTIHGEKSFECSLCPYKTAKKDKLVSHQKVHTKTSSDQTTNMKPENETETQLLLRKSIFPTKLNNRPTLNEKSHIKTQLRFPNIQERKTLLIQMIMTNF